MSPAAARECRFDELIEGLADRGAALRAVMRASRDGIVFHDALGRIVAANASAEEILGMTEAELLGETSFDRDPWCVREDLSPFPGAEHPAMVTLRTGEPVHGVKMGVYRPDGELRWIAINAEPLVASEFRRPVAVVAVFTEVSG